MALIKKFNPNQIYLSKRLEERLSSIYDYPVTIIEAPVGYGKTMALKEYLKKTGKPYIWSNEQTFEQAVEAINSVTCPEPAVFVIDNYQLVADKFSEKGIKDLLGSATENTRIVIVMQAVNSAEALEMVMSREMNYLSKADFELSKEEIVQYYKSCGIKLEESEADFLYKYTEGWISALYLQMLNYHATGTFEMTVDIRNLIGKAIWNNLDRVSQDFLIGMSVFNSFTLRQCIYISEKALPEKTIERLLNEGAFIRYDAKEGKYFMHSILKYFLDGEFNRMEAVFRKRILRKAGDWYRDNEMYEDAIEFYYKIRDFESILSMNFEIDVLHRLHPDRANRKIFMDITTNLLPELKEKYLRNYILFVYFLFLDNEREYYKRECQIVYKIITSVYKDSHEYEELMGEYYVLESFEVFNHADKIKENLEKAYGCLQKPSRILYTGTSYLFCCPSPAALYHRVPGDMEREADMLDEIMPVFYRLTDGTSKGMEALFRAEMLFLQGELHDAMKLCNKALYMASSRDQLRVQISAVMCMSRIAYLKGDTALYKESIAKMEEFTGNSERYEDVILCNLCTGFVAAAVNNIEKIPAWLKDHEKIERNTVITGLGFANIIYAKYLIIREEFDKFLSISGQMLAIAGIYNNIIYRIYTLIYMAEAKNQTGNRMKAKSLLMEAVELAGADEICIPFVENYGMLESLLSELENNTNAFIKKINTMAKKFIRGLQSTEKVSGEDKRFGLTKREMEVAKLAAQRFSNKEIAEQLFIAESTVKSNLKVIFNKLGINSRSELKKYL